MAIEERDTLLAELETAAEAEMVRAGPAGFDKAAVVKQFAGRAGRSTLYRNLDAILKSGRLQRLMTREMKKAAAQRASRAVVAASRGPQMPQQVTVNDVAQHGPLAVMEQLGICLTIAHQLIAHARNDAGAVKSPKLLHTASEHLRKTLETAVKLQEALRQTEDIDRFHQSVVQIVRDIAHEFPEIADMLNARLSHLTAQWTA